MNWLMALVVGVAGVEIASASHVVQTGSIAEAVVQRAVGAPRVTRKLKPGEVAD